LKLSVEDYDEDSRIVLVTTVSYVYVRSVNNAHT